MLKRFLQIGVFVVILGSLIGCAEESPAPSSTAEPRSVPLTFAAVEREMLPAARPEERLQLGRSLHYAALPGQRSMSLHLYVEPGATDPHQSGEVRAYIKEGERWFHVGVVSAYGLDDIEVRTGDRTGDGMRELHITGGLGAAYRELKLVGYDAEADLWQKELVMGTPQIVDLDEDGVEELIAVSAGSIPSYLTVYRWNGTIFEQANVGEQLGSEQAFLEYRRVGDQYHWVIKTDQGEYRYDNGMLVEPS